MFLCTIQKVTTGVFHIQPRGIIQKIQVSSNIDFLNSAPGVVYGKLRYDIFLYKLSNNF